MKRLLTLIFALISLPIFATAQEITGVVVDRSNSEVVEGAIVRLMDDQNVVGYALTDSNGKFSIKTKDKGTELIVAHMSYEAKSINVPQSNEPITIKLSPQATQIKEISVSAPSIRLRGDTITYNLGAYQKPSDITLEDALKNLPGVEIAESGAIRYQGQEISHFYVEGVDLLGGRYSIATTNIRANMVASVDVMENHQAIKMLQGRALSDNVAMNIRLKKEARLKPSGNVEGAVGYISDDVLYRVGLSGMLFSPQFQTISTVKFSNTGEQNSRAALSHFSTQRTAPNLAQNVLGSLTGATPPLAPNRYRTIHDGHTSINTVNKLKTEAELRLNANYTFNREHYTYQTQSTYYTGEDSTEEITENYSPLTKLHNPSLELKYTHNTAQKYLENSLTADISIVEQSLPTINHQSTIQQLQRAEYGSITNHLSVRKQSGKNHLALSSTNGYNTTPANKTAYTSPQNSTYNYIQNANGQTISSFNTLDFNRQIGKYLYLLMPVSLDFQYNAVDTYTSGRDAAPNALNGFVLSPYTSPQLQYKSPMGRLDITLLLPFGYSLLDYNQAPKTYHKATYNPNIRLNYTLSANSKVRLTANAGNTIGDALDFLINPIQTSYRTTTIKSGILSENKLYNATLHYDFKLPLHDLFLNTTAGYSHTKRNLITTQTITGEEITLSNTLNDNRTKTTTLGAQLSKYFRSLGSKISLRGYYNHTIGDIIQQDVFTEFTTNSYGASVEVLSNPLKWLEVSYTGNIGWNNSQYLGVNQTLSAQSHKAQISFAVVEKLRIFARLDYIRNQITAAQSVGMALLDLGASYRFKRCELTLSVNNILDARQFGYTVFSGLDTFSHTYALRGRELLLSFRVF